MLHSCSLGTQLEKAASTTPAEQREAHRSGREQSTATKCLGKARWEASSTTQTKPIKDFFKKEPGVSFLSRWKERDERNARRASRLFSWGCRRGTASF